VPAGRLKQLQEQMRKGQHVTLEKLFATEQKDFKVEHYGAAWSFVYWLAHGGDQQELVLHQRALGQFVVDCRAGRRDGRNLAVNLERTSLAELEKEWKQWVLELDPTDPYGGVRPPNPKEIDAPSGAALRRLSDYYAGLSRAKVEFSVAAQRGAGETEDRPLASGSLAIRRPNLLAARFAAGAGETVVACDGKTLHVSAAKGAPKQTEAPATLDAALGGSAPAGEAFSSGSLGVLAALFRANPQSQLLRGNESVRSLGTEEVGGAKCQHLRIAGPKANTELWIAEADRPLLLRARVELAGGKRALVITFKDWAPNAELPDKTFALPEGK
jgi:hypothetical protein